MYIYYLAEAVIIAEVVLVIACDILYIYNFVRGNRRDLKGIICFQCISILALFLLFGCFYRVILADKMETGLRENFIPQTKCQRLDTNRYQLYDGFGDDDWYRTGVTSPDFLGMYDTSSGTFTYYVKLQSFDILKR